MPLTLSVDRKPPQFGAANEICWQSVVAVLVFFGTTVVMAQPVDPSQLPRKVLPTDPVGVLFNDGPRVVYTQESGADPIEQLFWDREQKKAKIQKLKEAITDRSAPETSAEATDQTKVNNSHHDAANNLTLVPSKALDNTTGKQDPADIGESQQKVLGADQAIASKAIEKKSVRGASNKNPDPATRAADAGKIDGVKINGAQWPVSSRPKNAYGKKADNGRPWQGLVFSVPVGTVVRSIDAGRVMYANDFKNYGNLVIVDHGDRLASVYANNQKLLVKEGDLIGTGDVIALSGETGNIGYPALYFEIRKEGKPVDPIQFLKRR